jgi:hypothetical protein
MRYSGHFVVRVLLFAVAGALAFAWASGPVAFAQRAGRRGFVVRSRAPIFPIRPFFPLFPPTWYEAFRVPFFAYGVGLGFESAWLPRCGLSLYGCAALPLYPPIYVYGEETIQRPQLALKDGTIYNVTDYWLVNGQLHFRTLEDGGAKSVEHVIDLNQLDSQKTMDLDAQRGFRFVLRNEPLEQYLRDHPEMGAPGAAPPPPLPPSQP